MKRSHIVLLIALLACQVTGLTSHALWKAHIIQPQEGWKCGMKLCMCESHDHAHHHHKEPEQQAQALLDHSGPEGVIWQAAEQSPGQEPGADFSILKFLAGEDVPFFQNSVQPFFPVVLSELLSETGRGPIKPPEIPLLF